MNKYRVYYSTPISRLQKCDVSAPSATVAIAEIKKFEIPTTVLEVRQQDADGRWITVISTPEESK